MKARFFCESCGAEVRHSERTCPACGRTFTAVRCPRCGFEGGAKQFARGCPECGYLNVVPPAGGGAGLPSAARPRKRHQHVRAFSLPRFRLSTRFYRIALLLLVGLLIALVAALVVILVRR